MTENESEEREREREGGSLEREKLIIKRKKIPTSVLVHLSE